MNYTGLANLRPVTHLHYTLKFVLLLLFLRPLNAVTAAVPAGETLGNGSVSASTTDEPARELAAPANSLARVTPWPAVIG